MKIAIIDDCAGVLLLTKHQLESLSNELFTFRLPLVALNDIPDIQPDIIVCDYIMFDLTGLELIAQLKSKGVNCKYFLYTSLNENEVIQECTDNDIVFVSKDDSIQKVISEYTDSLEK